MEDIKKVIQEKYGQAALRVHGGGSSCCGATAASGLGCDPITTNLYDDAQARQIPEEALLASLGCGNPTALAQLQPGEVVLDLGSGGGIDVLPGSVHRRESKRSAQPGLRRDEDSRNASRRPSGARSGPSTKKFRPAEPGETIRVGLR